MPCPLAQDENAVQVIRHDDVNGYFDVREMTRDLGQAFIHYSADDVKLHF